MAKFEIAYKITSKKEGGMVLTDDKDDKGGMTFAGISRRYHPRWKGWGIIDLGNFSKDPRLEGLVKDYFFKQFWGKIKGNEITDQSIANFFYDTAVNFDLVEAVKTVQKICCVIPDGIVGPKTIMAINTISRDYFFSNLRSSRVKYRVERITEDPSQEKYFKGWVKRDVSDDFIV